MANTAPCIGRAWVKAVDGTTVARIDRVLQLVGMSPFTGISVGVDRGSPVDWDRYERHRSFPFAGRLRHVDYVPGEKAAENPEVIVQIERQIARIYE